MLFFTFLISCVSPKGTAFLNQSLDSTPDSAPSEERDSSVEVPTEQIPEEPLPPHESDSNTPSLDYCIGVPSHSLRFASLVNRWKAQDDRHPWKPGGLVAVGSSSIRRWEAMAQTYTHHNLIQRGFGGSHLRDVAYHAEELILRHQPRGVVVFAGTNDLQSGLPVTDVGNYLRCLVQRIRVYSRDVSIFFIAVTPTPARWGQWRDAEVLNAYAKELDRNDEHFFYVDIASPFLATGSPPDRSLFVRDGLHLSDKGYAIWDQVLRPLLDAALPATETPSPIVHQSGVRWLIDFGSHDGVLGRHTPSPDKNGQYWNNWHPIASGKMIFPGERLAQLQTDTGLSTDVELIITGGFSNTGRHRGGLMYPKAERLGDLAIATATEDYFYALPRDRSGGLQLRGLSYTKRYTVRIFATKRAQDVRATRYTLAGATTQSKVLQTSGPGAGSKGRNDRHVVAFQDIQPDPYGHLHIDVSIEKGNRAYLGMMEIRVE